VRVSPDGHRRAGAGSREQGSAGGGGRSDYGFFTDAVLQDYAREAVHQAVTNLDGRPAPAGTMTGRARRRLAGHPAARSRRPRSRRRLQPQGQFDLFRSHRQAGGRQGGDRHRRRHDAGRRGSLNIDDEGNPTQRTVLIEDGILQGYMQDSLNARLMGVAPTGNGRRESFAHLPLPRMTNTTMLNGECSAEEIIRSVKKGIYAVNFGGGQVDITNGKFVFSMSEAYLIENGKRDHPGQGRDPDRQRAGGDDAGVDDRQRHAPRSRRRYLRQGGTERAGRRRPAHPAHRRPDGRRHGLTAGRR
jgi:TldD protein